MVVTAPTPHQGEFAGSEFLRRATPGKPAVPSRGRLPSDQWAASPFSAGWSTQTWWTFLSRSWSKPEFEIVERVRRQLALSSGELWSGECRGATELKALLLPSEVCTIK